MFYADVNSVLITLSGKPYIAGIFRDTTEGKKTELALLESEERFRTLADNIPQLCWMANADGWIFWYNRRWYEYTGTTPAQMEGWGWQSVHDPGTLPQVLEQWKSSIATGKTFDMVFPLRGSDGVFRHFLTRVMPVFDQNGKVVRWFGTNTDITERKNAEEELRKLTEELKRSNADLQQFAYAASHDLQEPLRGIASFAGLLEKHYKGKLDKKADEFINYIVDDAKRMQMLIKDLLEYSQIDTKGKIFGITNCSVVLEEAIYNLRSAIEESGTQVTYDLLPTIMADRSN
jgi:PAS domain S-box-containing protein